MKATAMAPSPAAEATHLIEPCRNVAGRKRAGNARLEEEGRPIERPDRGRSSLDLQVGAGHEIPAAVTDNRRRPGPPGVGVGSAADADEDTPGRHGSLHVNTAASCDSSTRAFGSSRGNFARGKGLARPAQRRSGGKLSASRWSIISAGRQYSALLFTEQSALLGRFAG
jgi:hypothetical protein